MRIWPVREASHARMWLCRIRFQPFLDDEGGEDGASGEVRECQIERIHLSMSGKGTMTLLVIFMSTSLTSR
jgi:hypothetical protein